MFFVRLEYHIFETIATGIFMHKKTGVTEGGHLFFVGVFGLFSADDELYQFGYNKPKANYQ